MFNKGGYNLSDIAAVTGGNGRNGGDGFFNDGWWIILLFMFGWGGRGFGGGWGGEGGGNYGYLPPATHMLLAVLEKRVGFKLAQKDVFLNMAGGLKVSDPACDLAVVASILSSNFDVTLSNDITFAGEVGLSGEIRPVSQVERRISEAAKLGFKQIFVSSYSKIPSGLKKSGPEHNNIQIIEIANIQQLVKAIF